MPLIDYDAFFDEAEDFLIPTGLKERHFESFCRKTVEGYRGVRYSSVDSSHLLNFIFQMSPRMNTRPDEYSYSDLWIKTMHVVCNELIVRRKQGVLTPSPAMLMQLSSLEWMVKEHEKTGDQHSIIYHFLKGTEGTWHGDVFTPSQRAAENNDFVRNYLLDGLMKIADYQIDQYRKIPLQIGALLRLKGKAAAANEVGRLMEFLEGRPDSRPHVVKALIASQLPADVYVKQLRRAERGHTLDNALGL